MELVSKVHGVIQYEKENIIIFKKGIPGFEDYKKYILLDLEEYQPFKLLHSLDNDELAFVLISPFDVKKDYEINLKDEVKKSLQIKDPGEVILLTTVTLSSKVKNITTNLCAPMIVNINTGFAEQIILDNDNYKIKQPLMEV